MSDEKKKGGQSATAMTSAMGPPGLINKDDIPQVLPILPLRNSVSSRVVSYPWLQDVRRPLPSSRTRCVMTS